MRLLFDQNLSPRLIDLLSDSYPESAHVQKVIWIRRGNCSTTMIEQILRHHRDDIQQLSADKDITYLVLI